VPVRRRSTAHSARWQNTNMLAFFGEYTALIPVLPVRLWVAFFKRNTKTKRKGSNHHAKENPVLVFNLRVPFPSRVSVRRAFVQSHNPQVLAMQNHHTQSVYFGGSRNLKSPSSAVAQAVLSVLQSGQSVHVGDCIGADALVITSAIVAGYASSLVVFAISSASGSGACSLSSSMPTAAAALGSLVQWQAGGSQSVPLAGRLIKRSLAAAQGCEEAVFFNPGAGSLAVAAHLVGKMPIHAFSESMPAPIPGKCGQWCIAWFHGLQCWGWGTLPEPQEKQLSFI